MSAPSYARSLVCAAKRLKISAPPLPPAQTRSVQHQALPENIASELASLRLPRAVQATYLDPLKRTARKGDGLFPAAELQLRSYSIRNLEVFTDFALRAAYFLRLPAKGAKHLPKIIERWTVPRSNFVFKKSQENFERITLRRQINVLNGHPETVAVWLAFLNKYRYFGVGMKANVWERSGLGVVKDVDREADRIMKTLGERLELFGRREGMVEDEAKLEKMVFHEPFKGQMGALGAMGGNSSVPNAESRILAEPTGEASRSRR